MADIQINCDVKAIVEQQIQLAVAEALSKNQSVFIESVVRAALTQKKDTYSNRTLLQDTLDAMIRKAATAALEQWVQEKLPEIQREVLRNIRMKDGLAKQLAEQLVEAVAKNMHVSIAIKETR